MEGRQTYLRPLPLGHPAPPSLVSRTPGLLWGHSLHGWLWRALSVPMAFLVSPGRMSSSGEGETGVSGSGSVLFPVRLEMPGSWCGAGAAGRLWSVGPPVWKAFCYEKFQKLERLG